MSVSVMVAPSPGSPATGSQTRLASRGDNDPRVHVDPQGVSGADDLAGRESLKTGLDAAATVANSVPGKNNPALAADLLQLTKPRIVTMILVTTVIAALIAGGGTMAPLLLCHLVIGVALVAGSAGAMNQVWEHQIDGQMERTRRRPIAAGRIGFWAGFSFSIILGAIGSGYLWLLIGPAPALFAIATWVLYVPIYTPLKVRSEWNTTVGAISGALPMMIGYTASGGSAMDPTGWLLVGVLMAWQYPHFMAIAWLFRRQYAEAGFQMTTTVEPTGRRAAIQSVAGMLILAGCLLGLVYLIVGSVTLPAAVMMLMVLAVTYPMTAAAVRFWHSRDDLTARKLLRASLLQLPASLLLLTIAALVWGR